MASLSVAATAIVCLLSGRFFAMGVPVTDEHSSSSAEAKTVEIAPNVFMPKVNLGTCCGSSPDVGLAPWLKAGGTGIDTAWSYKDQANISRILATEKIARSSIFVTTKIPPPSRTKVVPAPACTAEFAVGKMQYDLAQLGMKYVDLVLIHHPDTDACNQALWKGLEQAQSMGLTKAIGVSNFSPAQMEAIMRVGPTPVVNQCGMSLKNHDDATIAWCQAHRVTYEAFDAMKGCDFSSSVVQGIATSHGVGVAQVCLRWVLQRGAVMAVGTGSNPATAGQYSAEDLDLFSFNLTAPEMSTLNALK